MIKKREKERKIKKSEQAFNEFIERQHEAEEKEKSKRERDLEE